VEKHDDKNPHQSDSSPQSSLLSNPFLSDIVSSMATKKASTSSPRPVRKAPAKKVEKTAPAPVASEPRKEQASAPSTATKGQMLKNLKRPQILIPVAILLAVVVVYLLKSWFVVAVVNGQLITRPAFESAMEKQDGKQILNNLVTEKLLQQEAAKKGISVSQSDVDSQVKKIDQQLAGQGQTLDQALAARGMTRADLEQQLKLQTLLQKLLANQIKVSDQEVQDYVDKNRDSLPTGQSEDELKTTVRQQLEQQKLTTSAQSLVQKLQQQAHITYFINL